MSESLPKKALSASVRSGSKAIKKILSGAVNIAVSVAELRNQGFGSGHGQASVPSGLGVRHARLTVNAAVTWCELILDTLGDPVAPWRKGKRDHLRKS
ncbi:abortive infection family protein [Streptomyces mirabilis]|uniref:abortive infection family protein n=1 Tax=Streptomyces mirabilis TaxID=68239 RepID=UPI003329652A